MICTFYSYKGGVGRSMALANVADLLARRGVRVLMIDFDLEAPGLEKFFQVNQEGIRRHLGLLDLLLAYKHSMSLSRGDELTFKDLSRFVCPVYERLKGGGRLDLMPAGQRGSAEALARYALNLRSFDWQDFYFNWQGELFFEWMRRSLTPDRYDLALVDSRTGVTEMGGICGYQLADSIVMMCAANHQNVEGTQAMIGDFLSPNVMDLRRGRELQIVVVPARIEQHDPSLLAPFFERFDAAFAGQIPASLTKRGLGFRDLMVPYEPEYAFEERVVTDPSRTADRKRIGGAFERLADAVAALADPSSVLGKTAAATAPAPDSVGRDVSSARSVDVQYDVARRFAGYDVFLDSSGEDLELTQTIVRELKRRGLSVFYDRTDLPAGDNWESIVEDALFHSRVLLYCVGVKGLSEWRLRTLEIARATRARDVKLRIVPVLLPQSDPSALEGLPISDCQSVDLRPLEGPAAIDRLCQAIQPDRRPAAVLLESRDPFPGLRSFAEQDSVGFFGREEEINELVGKVSSSSFVALVGPSGTGKTSLVQAGVIPALRASVTPAWVVRRCEGRGDALECLRNAVQELRTEARDRSARMLLLVDQLEGAYGMLQDAGQQDRVLSLVVSTVADFGNDGCVLLTVRDDFLPRLSATCPALARLIAQSRMSIRPMTPEGLRRCIEGPAETAGVAFEPGLVERIVGDLASEPQALSLLQMLLTQLWNDRREGWLTNAAYDASGGLRGFLANQAERVYGSLGESEQQMVRVILLRLIGGGREGEETRRRLPITAIRPAIAGAHTVLGKAFEGALDALLEARLLRATEESGQRAVEPIHESLIRGWSRMRDWITAERDSLRWRQSLDHRYAAWVEDGRRRNSPALLRGAELRDAQHRLSDSTLELTLTQTELLRASRQLKSRTNLTTWAAVGLAAAALSGSLLAYAQFKSAKIEVELANKRAEADRQNAEATKSKSDAELLQASIERAAVLRNEGKSLLAKGAIEDAQARFEESLRLQYDIATDCNLAWTHARKGDPSEIEQAEALLNEAIQGAGTRPSSRRDLSDCYVKRGDVRMQKSAIVDAATDYQRATEVDPNNEIAWFDLGHAHELLTLREVDADKQAELASAIAAYTKTIALDDDFVEAYFNRAEALLQLGKRNDAIADFKKVQALPSAEPQMKKASLTRLEQLGAAATAAKISDNGIRVSIQYAEKSDADFASKVVGLLTQAGYRKTQTQLAPGTSIGQIRYYYAQDEQAASDVRRRVSDALAKRGKAVSLSLVRVDQKRTSSVGVGTIEVSLPPLSAPVAVAPMRRAKMDAM